MVTVAARNGVVASVLVVGMQAVYRLYPGHFVAVALGVLVLLLFYRKLDNIESALSEARRRDRLRRRQAAGQIVVVFLVVVGVLSGLGSYAVWNWLLVD